MRTCCLTVFLILQHPHENPTNPTTQHTEHKKSSQDNVDINLEIFLGNKTTYDTEIVLVTTWNNVKSLWQ